jgi:hypothetical protein
MRRIVTAALIATLIGGIGSAPPAQAHHREGPCAVHWWKAWTEHRDVGPIKDLIRCAAARWAVPGGAPKALDVAACESGFRPNTYWNGNAGVFQHRTRYWDGRYDDFTRSRWGLRPSVYNGRTNVIVSIRMAHRYGWGAWSCA